MMDSSQTARFEALKDKWCDYTLVQELYGIKLQADAPLLGRFNSWGRRLHRKREVERPGQIDRHAIEAYFQFSKSLPKKWAAARLGMEETSLDEILGIMDEKGLVVVNNMDFSDQTIDETFIREFNRYFPSLQFRIFSDHDDFCTRLHQAIKEELGMEVAPVRCVTSEAMGQDPPDFAHDFDAITLEPIGIRYQVWLDFKKPMNLRPDYCSLKLYAAERDTLRPYVFSGNEPEIPEALSRA